MPSGQMKIRLKDRCLDRDTNLIRACDARTSRAGERSIAEGGRPQDSRRDAGANNSLERGLVGTPRLQNGPAAKVKLDQSANEPLWRLCGTLKTGSGLHSQLPCNKSNKGASPHQPTEGCGIENLIHES